MKLIFMGSPEFAVPTLKALQAAKHEILAVYSQPPRPANRGKKVTPCLVHAYAESEGLTAVTPQSFTNHENVEKFKAFEPELVVVAAYGLILPKKVLEVPKYGCLNVHPSLLPRWRGAAPIQRPIIEGDKTTGVTIMKMDEGCDTGDILLYKKVPITAEDTFQTMHDSLSVLGAELMVQAIVGMQHGVLKPIKQDDDKATYAKKLSKDEGPLDFKRSAEALQRKIRGANPWPGAWFTYKGEHVKIRQAHVVESDFRAPPGQAVCAEEITGGELWIATRQGFLVPDILQRPNREALPIADFLRGFPIPDGEKLK